MTSGYIAVTLVGGHKLYSMPLFFEYLLNLNTLPEELLISATREIFDKCMEVYTGDIPVTWVHGEGDLGNDRVLSTTAAREALRKVILERGYEWSMWLDNDILVPPDMMGKFKQLLKKKPDLLWVNAFHPARQEGGNTGRMRHGLGSSFIHRELLEAIPFYCYTLRNKFLGDDYPWKVIAGSFSRVYKFETLAGVYFNVKHAVEDGTIHEFTEEQRAKIDEVYST